MHLIDVLVASGIERNISLKLTQLGASVDRATCVDNLRRILDAAERHGFFVRIDMESSAYTDLTLDIFETLWNRGHHNLGVVIQAALKRSEADVAARQRARRAHPPGERRLQGAARRRLRAARTTWTPRSCG